MDRLKGIFPALLTPFDRADRINEGALEQLIEMNLAKGVRGFYVCGSTAEVFLLKEQEREQLYRCVKEIVGDRAALIAHVGDISTDKAKGYARLAESLGYDAVSAVGPFNYKFSFEEIKQYYLDLVGSTRLPMILYHFPNFSGIQLSVAQMGDLLENERIIGIKHTSSDTFALSQFKNAYPEKIIYNGYDEMLLAGLSMGADGGIGSTYNFMAEKFLKLVELFQANRMPEAQELQMQINVIIAALCEIGVMQGEKAILREMGLEFGTARAPYIEPDKDKLKKLMDTVMPLLG